MNWISIEEEPIDFKRVAFIKSEEMGIFPFTNQVGIFEHEKILFNILTATHWMPLPESTKRPSFR